MRAASAQARNSGARNPVVAPDGTARAVVMMSPGAATGGRRPASSSGSERALHRARSRSVDRSRSRPTCPAGCATRAKQRLEPRSSAAAHHQVDERLVQPPRNEAQGDSLELRQLDLSAGRQLVGRGQHHHQLVLPHRDELQPGRGKDAAYEGRIELTGAHALQPHLGRGTDQLNVHIRRGSLQRLQHDLQANPEPGARAQLDQLSARPGVRSGGRGSGSLNGHEHVARLRQEALAGFGQPHHPRRAVEQDRAELASNRATC